MFETPELLCQVGSIWHPSGRDMVFHPGRQMGIGLGDQWNRDPGQEYLDRRFEQPPKNQMIHGWDFQHRRHI